jgi:hypothetical protein
MMAIYYAITDYLQIHLMILPPRRRSIKNLYIKQNNKDRRGDDYVKSSLRKLS